jgi:hypothetical protein
VETISENWLAVFIKSVDPKKDADGNAAYDWENVKVFNMGREITPERIEIILDASKPAPTVKINDFSESNVQMGGK